VFPTQSTFIIRLVPTYKIKPLCSSSSLKHASKITSVSRAEVSCKLRHASANYTPTFDEFPSHTFRMTGRTTLDSKNNTALISPLFTVHPSCVDLISYMESMRLKNIQLPLRCRLLMKLTFDHLVKKFPAIYGIRKFITEFIRTCLRV
jgi:hypothetical protein